MNHRLIFLCAMLPGMLAACASSPSPAYFTLGQQVNVERIKGASPRIAITQVTLPELIDRPQIVFRTSDQQVRISELQRWAEPLRRQIPSALAEDLGQLLGTNQVVSLPVDSQRFDADYRLTLDIQRFEFHEGEGAVADIFWRLEPRQGNPLTGRSVVREKTNDNATTAVITAQRRCLQSVASEIAAQIRNTHGGKP